MKTALLLTAILCAWLYYQNEDYKAELSKAKPVRSECACSERDYLGRTLVASYCGHSDQIQTKRCAYARMWT